jgi:hypothetical protein
MPRISWSLAAALSMSALAVFRPEIGSKSLAAHAARSFTRVVESITQRFQSGSAEVASATDERRSTKVDVALVQSEAALSVPRSGDGIPSAPVGAETAPAKSVYAANSGLSAAAVSDLGHVGPSPTRHASPPAAHFASVLGIENVAALALDRRQIRFSPQTNERHWKDCAVAAICSGIPGPSTLRSTLSALGKPPSV